jgi:hypothetical protein
MIWVEVFKTSFRFSAVKWKFRGSLQLFYLMVTDEIYMFTKYEVIRLSRPIVIGQKVKNGLQQV